MEFLVGGDMVIGDERCYNQLASSSGTHWQVGYTKTTRRILCENQCNIQVFAINKTPVMFCIGYLVILRIFYHT